MADTPQGAQVTVLLVHRDDEDAVAMLELLEAHVSRGDVVEHLTLTVDGATGPDAALWRAHRSGQESEDDPLLFERLADIGRIERLRMVGLSTLSADGPARDLDRAMNALTSTAARLLGADRARLHARLAVLGYGEPMVPSVFFSTLADVNAAVLPYDRLEDASIARPVERSAAELFRTHGAIEVASACGLWRTMDASPMDGLRGANASGSIPRVRFLQSRIRLLRTPPLPVGELVAERREIPIPDGHQPAVDAERLMPRLADLLLPPELTYAPAAEPDDGSQDIAAGRLAAMLGREVVASVLELPAFLWRSIGGEVTTFTRRVLQQAVGAGSRYRVAGEDPTDQPAGQQLGLIDGEGRPVDLETVVAEPEVLAHFDPIPGEIWTTLVAEVLGSIDGDPDCRDLREQAFGDARFLPVDRALLLGGMGELPPRLVALLEPRVRVREVDLDEVAAAEPPAEDTGEVAAASPEAGEDAPVPAEPPVIVSLLAAEREITERIALEWERIADVAGGLWNGARATYRAMSPVTLAGGILTLKRASTSSSGAFHVKRAASPNFVEALLRAIPEVLERHVEIQAVQPVATLDGWEPLLHDVLLAQFLGLDAEAGELDRLMASAALLDVPPDAPPLRHEALTADDLDQLSAFVESEEQAAFIRDYATFLRTLAAEPPSPVVPPPSGAPIAGLAPPPEAAGTPPAPSGLPFLDIPPPPVDEDDVDEDWDLDEDPDAVDPTSGTWGLLVGVREQIRRQREAAERDVERILGHLRTTRSGDAKVGTAVSPAVPAGAGLGAVLLVLWLGQTSLGIRLISSLGLNEFRRDALFTVMTLLLVVGAATLTDLGKRLSGQARAIILVGTSVLVISGVLFFFERLRQLVPFGMRETNLLAFSLGALAFAVVLLALLQSLGSMDPVRIQGSRFLVLALILYAVAGLLVWQVQSRAGLVALEDETSSRVGGVLLSTGLALLLAAIAVLAVVRFREARRRDDAGIRDRWAVEHIGLAVDARERLRAAERQWVVSMIAIAQVLRQPFGPVRETDEVDDEELEQGSAALKAASVRVRLTDRGRSDLEARIRQMLVGPSWLRRRYQAMVDAHQRILATRLGMPVRNLADRRPEADPTVPSEIDLRAARGRGDRMEFVKLAASGVFDASLSQAIEELDVRTVFEPMLAESESHVLEGYEKRAATVEQYFRQLLPESEPTLPNDVVSTVLAAHDRRRHLEPFVWWPTMLPEPDLEGDVVGDVALAQTVMFRHGKVGGAGLVAVRVDLSQEFPYTEIANVASAPAPTGAAGHAAEAAADYGSDVGL